MKHESSSERRASCTWATPARKPREKHLSVTSNRKYNNLLRLHFRSSLSRSGSLVQLPFQEATK
ncbi:hypothetical protein M407DRAFT_246101 [Tulasnella calospora MUT 4182]|uniref:Uncharacterized protein n=1 Tax=Tulasnella calospora MUT 4182 TaxID=1051891 RepID=A0A0C3PX63_9AGAM|nr:hypothetical protein M407DRAFT_246101 [Tulasnella calospora MUT 4182]